LVRAVIVISGAAGFCAALAVAASASVGNPADAYQSAFKIALAGQPVPRTDVIAPKPRAAQPRQGVARVEPAATPVPEQFVSQGPGPAVAPKRSHGSAVAGLVGAAEARYRQIESFFGRVASTAQSGATPGTGVPVLVVGFLTAVAVVEHQRRRVRWAAGGRALEFLYARELTPPG
jgi:hypothetical protein